MKRAILILVKKDGVKTIEERPTYASAFKDLRIAKKNKDYAYGMALQVEDSFGKVPFDQRVGAVTKVQEAEPDEAENVFESLFGDQLETGVELENESAPGAGNEADSALILESTESEAQAETESDLSDPFMDDFEDAPESQDGSNHPPRGRGRPRKNG